ncbi:MAG: VWA domain-containing protein [Vicinamibacterales bacterium]
MRRHLFVTLLALALALALGSTHAQLQEPAPASPQPTLLSVDAVAVDRKGNPVTDLRPGDVEIWLEQYRIPLESMTVLTKDDERRRRTIVLLLDDITLAPELMPRAREAGRHLVTALEPEDRMAVVTLTGASIKATDDRAALRRAVDAYGVRATEPLRPDDLAAKVLNLLTAIARQAAELPGHRRTVVAIGPGWVFDTPIPPSTVARDLRGEWTDAMRAMVLANVTLYVIDPGGVGAMPATSGAIGMARETGGHAFLNTNDVTGAVDRIMRDAVSYYILRFEDPPFFRTAPLRKLDVRVKRRDVTVRARQLIPGTPAAKR